MGIIDVSIIIVSFNTKYKTLRCIESIYKYTKDLSFEIIVSENGSNDGSLEAICDMYPDILTQIIHYTPEIYVPKEEE